MIATSDTAALVRRLLALDCCAISDALDQLSLPGAVLGLRALSVQRRIAGEVTTVQLGAADGRNPARHLCTAAVDAAGPGNVIAIAHEGRTDAAGWGGVLSAAASHRGIEGIVIDGACRDIDESIELHFPVYGRCTVPVTARGRIIEYDWNVPVRIAGVHVAPGDFVIADGSGVVFISRANIVRIIEIAETIVERERRMAAEVREGTAVSKVMGSAYENMLQRGGADD